MCIVTITALGKSWCSPKAAEGLLLKGGEGGAKPLSKNADVYTHGPETEAASI